MLYGVHSPSLQSICSYAFSFLILLICVFCFLNLNRFANCTFSKLLILSILTSSHLCSIIFFQVIWAYFVLLYLRLRYKINANAPNFVQLQLWSWWSLAEAHWSILPELLRTRHTYISITWPMIWSHLLSGFRTPSAIQYPVKSFNSLLHNYVFY